MQKVVLYAILLVFIISCQPDKDEELVTPDPIATPDPVKTCRLNKIIQGIHNGAADDTTFTFYYDASGKITKINHYNPQWKENKDFLVSRDASGRLISVATSDNRYFNKFKYNSGGLLEEITRNMSLDTMIFRFEYGSDTLPQKCIRIRLSFKDTSEYRYTYQNGNLVTKEYVSKGGIPSSKHYYEYDTIPNMPKDLILIGHYNIVAIGFFDEFLYFNKNLLKKYKSPSSQYHINYKVDSGRITKSVLNWLKSPAFTDTTQRDTRHYFYECQ